MPNYLAQIKMKIQKVVLLNDLLKGLLYRQENSFEMIVHQCARFKGHNSAIYSLLDLDGEDFLSAGGDGWVARWPSKEEGDGTLICDVKEQIFSIALHKEILLIGCMDGHLYHLEFMQEAAPRKIQYHKKGVFDIMSLNEHILTLGGDGKMSIWDGDMTLIEVLSISHSSLRSISISPDQSILAIGASDRKIYLVDADSFALISQIDMAHDPSVFCTAFINDSILVSGGRDARLKCWDIKTGKLQENINAHWYTINSLALHPNQPMLATGSRDRTIRLWNTEDMSPILTLDQAHYDGHINSVNKLLWSRSGSHLISASDDRTIISWECKF